MVASGFIDRVVGIRNTDLAEIKRGMIAVNSRLESNESRLPVSERSALVTWKVGLKLLKALSLYLQ